MTQLKEVKRVKLPWKPCGTNYRFTTGQDAKNLKGDRVYRKSHCAECSAIQSMKHIIEIWIRIRRVLVFNYFQVVEEIIFPINITNIYFYYQGLSIQLSIRNPETNKTSIIPSGMNTLYVLKSLLVPTEVNFIAPLSFLYLNYLITKFNYNNNDVFWKDCYKYFYVFIRIYFGKMYYCFVHYLFYINYLNRDLAYTVWPIRKQGTYFFRLNLKLPLNWGLTLSTGGIPNFIKKSYILKILWSNQYCTMIEY